MGDNRGLLTVLFLLLSCQNILWTNISVLLKVLKKYNQKHDYKKNLLKSDQCFTKETPHSKVCSSRPGNIKLPTAHYGESNKLGSTNYSTKKRFHSDEPLQFLFKQTLQNEQASWVLNLLKQTVDLHIPLCLTVWTVIRTHTKIAQKHVILF